MNGGVDVETLGLRVEDREVAEAARTLDTLTAASKRAEQGADGLTRATQHLGASEQLLIREWMAKNTSARQQVEQLQQVRQATEQVTQAQQKQVSSYAAIAAARGGAVAAHQRETQQLTAMRAAYAGAGQSLAAMTTVQTVNNTVTAASVINIGKVRQAMTALAASQLALMPGVASLTSGLGAMALGAAPMVAILAAVAALAFGWKRLTEDARELKAAVKEAREEIDKMQQGEAAGLAFNAGTLSMGIADNRRKLEGPQWRSPRAQEELKQQIAADERRVQKYWDRINEIHAEGQKKTKEIAERALKEQQDLFQKWYAAAEQFHRSVTRVAIDAAYAQMNAARGGQGAGAARVGGAGTVGSSAPFFVVPIGPFDGADRTTADRYQPKGGMTTAEGMSAIGLSTSFLGIAGAGQNLIQSFVEARKAAKEMADEFKRTSAAIIQGFQSQAAGLRAQMGGDPSTIASVAAGSRMRGMFQTWQGTLPEHVKIKPGFGPSGDSAAEVAAWLEGFKKTADQLPKGSAAFKAYQEMIEVVRLELEALKKAEQERAAALKLQNQQLREDYEVRRLAASGHGQEAADLAYRNQQQREYNQAVKDGLEEATLAALTLAQAAEAAARAAAIVEQRTRFTEDLTARSFAARGMDRAAEDARIAAANRRELYDAQGMSPADIALIQSVQAQEKYALILQRDMEDQTKVINDRLAAQTSVLDKQLATARDEMELSQAALNVAQEQLRAQEQSVAQTQRVMDTLRQFSEGLKLGPLSTYSPSNQLVEARRQFDAQISAARSGDKNAAMGIPDSARAFLEASRGYNASGPGYVADFLRTQAAVAEITDKFGAQLSIEQQMLAQMQLQTGKLQEQISYMQAQIATAQGAKEAAQIAAAAEIAELVKHYEQLLRTANAVNNPAFVINTDSGFTRDVWGWKTPSNPVDPQSAQDALTRQVASGRDLLTEARTQVSVLAAGFVTLSQKLDAVIGSVDDLVAETRNSGEKFSER